MSFIIQLLKALLLNLKGREFPYFYTQVSAQVSTQMSTQSFLGNFIDKLMFSVNDGPISRYILRFGHKKIAQIRLF